MPFAAQYAEARVNLNQLTPEKLDEKFTAAVKWFEWDDELVDESTTRELKIDAILSADPIVCDGGLFDFLCEHGLLKE